MKVEMIVVSSFIFGAMIGSFLNVCIYRIPLNKSLVWPGSSCPACKEKIALYHNIPILSFALLKGRCASCNQPISLQYPFIELISAVLTVVLVMKFGLTNNLFFYLVLTYFLIVISVIDLQTRMIHNRILIALGFAALVMNLFFPVIPWKDALLGFLVGGVVMYLFARLGTVLFKKEAMGMGDVKFAAVAGLFFGWKIILIALYLGFVLALFAAVILRLFKKFNMDQPVPLGPFLAGGLLLFILAGDELINVYIDLFI